MNKRPPFPESLSLATFNFTKQKISKNMITYHLISGTMDRRFHLNIFVIHAVTRSCGLCIPCLDGEKCDPGLSKERVEMLCSNRSENGLFATCMLTKEYFSMIGLFELKYVLVIKQEMQSSVNAIC